jgi:hypothetical protein
MAQVKTGLVTRDLHCQKVVVVVPLAHYFNNLFEVKLQQ